MQTYIGTKIIQAEPLAKNYGPPETHGQPGYKVVYPDGYTSWSPAAAFEEAYRPCDAMTFGLALEALKKGKRVARAAWSGMQLKLMPPMGLHDFSAQDSESNTTAKWLGKGTILENSYCIAELTADKKWFPGWIARHADMLAEDWVIVE